MAEQGERQPSFRCQKCWQLDQPVVILQLAPQPKHPDDPAKFFLKLDARQESYSAAMELEKPANLQSQAAFTNLVRKYALNSVVSQILKHNTAGDIWVALDLMDGKERWWIKLTKSRPPDVSLINGQKETLIRWGQKGTFTKKRPYEGEWPADNPDMFRDITNVLWGDLLGQLQPEDEDEEESAGDANLPPEQRALVRRLRRRLKTLKKTARKTASEIPDESELKELALQARLLQNFLYRVSEGDFELRLPASISGEDEEVVIPLESEVSPGKNLELLFQKLKKLEKARQLQTAMAEKIRKETREVEADIERLSQSAASPEEWASVSREHQFSEQKAIKPKQAPEEAKPYRIFKSSLGHDILVGKGARDNDEMTKKAKSNDYWLHTVAVTGSHVLVPAVKDVRERLPEKTKREAAILAIHYSRLKDDLAGEVYFTRKSQIRKRKGMPDGLWLVERSETVFIRYTAEELQALLERQVR